MKARRPPRGWRSRRSCSLRSIYELLMPQLELQQAPERASERRFLLDERFDLRRVEETALAAGPRQEDVAEEIAHAALGPEVQRHRKAHLVRALEHRGGHDALCRLAEIVPQLAAAEPDRRAHGAGRSEERRGG